jgi:hypothetical protein
MSLVRKLVLSSLFAALVLAGIAAKVALEFSMGRVFPF